MCFLAPEAASTSLPLDFGRRGTGNDPSLRVFSLFARSEAGGFRPCGVMLIQSELESVLYSGLVCGVYNWAF